MPNLRKRRPKQFLLKRQTTSRRVSSGRAHPTEPRMSLQHGQIPRSSWSLRRCGSGKPSSLAAASREIQWPWAGQARLQRGHSAALQLLRPAAHRLPMDSPRRTTSPCATPAQAIKIVLELGPAQYSLEDESTFSRVNTVDLKSKLESDGTKARAARELHALGRISRKSTLSKAEEHRVAREIT
jgi:hypothetical protein